MSSAGNQEVQKARRKLRIWLSMAIILLMLMALLSSLGEAFIYVFSGLSFFFAYQAWHQWSFIKNTDEHRYTRSERTSSRSSFTTEIHNTFRDQSHPGSIESPTTLQARKVVLIASAFIGIVFLLIIVSVIFSSGDADTAETDADSVYETTSEDDSYSNYRRAIAENANDPAGFYGLAGLKASNSEFDSAIYFYDKVLQLNADNYDAAYGKALVYFTQKDYDKSLQQANYIISRTDAYVDAYLVAGDCFYFQKQYDGAIGYYEKAYAKGIRSKELLHIMAYIYDVRGQQEKAITFYKETLRQDSTMTDIYQRLGELLPGEEGNFYRHRASGQQW